MRILVDENIPSVTVHELRAMGHDVLDIRGTPKEGILDDAVWALAQTDQRILITTDKGFSEHRGERHCGLLVVRLRQPNQQRIHSRVMAVLQQFTEQDWPGLFVAVRDVVQSISRSQ